MIDETWIKLYRKIIDSLAFKNEKCLKIWIWCLCKAGYTEKEILLGRQKIQLKRGQFIMGGIKTEESLNLARTTIYYWLDFLKEEGMVDIKKTNKYTIITILNWDEYQNVDNKSTSNDTTNGHQMDTNKKDKNIKKDKNTYSEQSLSILESWNSFAEKNNLSKVIKLTDIRNTHIINRLKEPDFNLDKILSLVEESDFLLGKKTDWKIDFDFIFSSKNNYIKILEGKYNGSQNHKKEFEKNSGGEFEVIK